MKKEFGLFVALFGLTGCGGLWNAPSQSIQSKNPTGPSITLPKNANGQLEANVLQVDIGQCGAYAYFNEPCVSVTVCVPGTTTCQTIPNILLDTGSYGLRIFSSALNISLPQITDSQGSAIAECAHFGSGNDWGPVKNADVVLGGEPAVQVPIQVIDLNYGDRAKNCTGADSGPETAGFNGILGVGLFKEDCGLGCAKDVNNQIYFSCQNGNCVSAAVSIDKQVSNPVSHLPLDNNGVILEFPSVPTSGSSYVMGALVLGIDTRADNSSAGARLFKSDERGYITTHFNGKPFSASFIDSGSNGLYFPNSDIETCGSSAPGFFCPSKDLTFTATQVGLNGFISPQITVAITKALNAIKSTGAYSNIGASLGGALAADFDWGMPFFYGRSIFFGLSGKSSLLGSGPYYAY